MAILLYAPLILNDTRDSVFFSLYALNTSSQRYDSAYIVNLCFLAPKCVLGSRLCSSTRYAILSATSDLSAFPSVRRREIGLQLFATIQSPCFGFYSGIIFTTFHSQGTFPILSNLVKRVVISPLSMGHSSYHTLASRPSLLGALSGLALNTAALTLYLAMGSYGNQLQLVIASSSYSHGGGTRKNAWSSSLAILWFSVTTSPYPLSFLISGILANADIAYRLRYFDAFYILSLLLRNSSQQSFLCRQIVLQKSFFTLAAILYSLGLSLPCLCIALFLFLQYVYNFLSIIRSSFHHLFIYGNGLAHWQCALRALLTYLLRQLTISSTSSIGNPISFYCFTSSRILSQFIFLISSLSWLSCMPILTQKLVQIALQSNPYLCSQIAHFTSLLARPGVASIRLIINIRPTLLLNIGIPTRSRLQSNQSAIKLIISALSSCVNVVLI